MKSNFSAFVSFRGRQLPLGAIGLSLAVVALVLGVPAAAMAQSATLGDMLCTAAINMVPRAGFGGGTNWGLASLINGVAYIAGAVTIGSGLVLLARSYEDPKNTPIHQPIWRIIAGAALLSFPAFVQWIIISLFITIGPSGVGTLSGACSITGQAASDGGIIQMGDSSAPLDQLMMNLTTSISQPLSLFLSIMSLIIGMVFVFKGLQKASRYGTDPRAYSATSILAHLLVGAALISVGATMTTVFGSIFGDTGLTILPSSLFWSAFEDGSFVQNLGFTYDQLAQFEDAVGAALTFFQLIGFIAFIRGWMILKGYAEGSNNATAAQGLTHIIGGAMAINIYQMLLILDWTFGTGFLA